ncbi:uncharacterized protein LOC122556526 [Chiloscyllium plagiosum]|uniref:uncharacterized protein LOC122556526 n=1 Tax=Chiloscyllium plagiosum TaxID=36176 RepID=UPI001CB7E368|nr:uncharacterized protein LOC122556526 [Chiloscyllium plagiosum]
MMADVLETDLNIRDKPDLKKQAAEDVHKTGRMNEGNELSGDVKKGEGMQGENVVQCLATGFGNTYISTFSESQFEFRGHCSYVLLRDNSDPHGFSILLDQEKDCLKGKCMRKIIFNKGNIPVLELLTIADFFQKFGESLPMIYNGMYIYGTQQELFIKINKGLTVLWNGKGTVIVSMKKPIDVTGLCSHSGGKEWFMKCLILLE